MLLTRSQELAHAQEAEGDSHDGSFVQVGGHPAGERQSVGELIKHLRLLTPPTPGCITRAQLPLLRTAPAGGRRQRDKTWLTLLYDRDEKKTGEGERGWEDRVREQDWIRTGEKMNT